MRTLVHKLFGKFDGDDIGVAAGTDDQSIQLVFESINYLRMGESNLVSTIAVKIKVAAVLQIFDKAAMAGFENVETWRLKALMQKNLGITLQPLGAGCLDGGLDPLSSLR